MFIHSGQVYAVRAEENRSTGRHRSMIKLRRLNGDDFLLNAELIQYVESRPDTYITLAGGERVIVEQPLDEVLRRVIEYQRAKHLVPPAAR